MSTIPAWCRVGAKLMCVDGGPRKFSTVNLPVEGRIYTVQSVKWCDWPSGDSGPGVYLVEIRRVVDKKGVEWPFGLTRFRPLVTIEDDLEAHFTTLLHVPADQKADA